MTRIKESELICENTDDEVVDVILQIGEKCADIKLFPYQEDFAREIIHSVVTSDATTITALFARQCLDENSVILTPTGPTLAKNLKPGDIVYSRVNGAITEDVVESTHAFEAPGVLVLADGHSATYSTYEHRFYNSVTGAWMAARDIEPYGNSVTTPFPLLSLDNTAPHFHTQNYPELTPQEVAEQALLMQYGKADEDKLVTRLLGQTQRAKIVSKFALESFTKALGISENETSMEGTRFTIRLPDNLKLRWNECLNYRKDIIQHFCRDAEIVRVTKGLKRPMYELRIPCFSDGEFRVAMTEFLSLSGVFNIDPITAKLHHLVIKDKYALLLLLPFVSHLPFYDDLYSQVWFESSAHHKIKAYKPDILPYLKEKYPLAKKFLSVRAKGKAYYRVKEDMHPLFEYAKAVIKAYGYSAWSDMCPKEIHRSLSRPACKPKTFTAIELETSLSGNYLAHGTLSHNCGKSESLKIALIGMLIWLPLLASRYPKDPRWQKFRNGFWAGVFAPVMKQSLNVYNRVRNVLKSPSGKAFLNQLGFEFPWPKDQVREFILSNGSSLFAGPASPEANIESMTYHIVIGDEAQDIDSFKWTKSIVPMTTFTAGTKVLVGTANTKLSNFYKQIQKNKSDIAKGLRKTHFEVDWTVPARYNRDYEKSVRQAVEEMGATSDAFRMAYCNQFIFSRGMAIDPELLEYRSTENPRGIIYNYETVNEYRGDKRVVVGIDIGQKHDPTVCIAVEVDPNDVIVDLNFRTYQKRVIGTFEMLGDDIDLQTPEIVDFIDRMKATTVVVDSTGIGDPYYVKLNKARPHLNWVRFKFTQESKSNLFKAFLADAGTGRLMLPGGDIFAKSSAFYKMIMELSELEKHYNGQYLNCKAPERRNAHDDYPVALALACWGCKDYYLGGVKQTENMFLRSGRSVSRRSQRFSNRRRKW